MTSQVSAVNFFVYFLDHYLFFPIKTNISFVDNFEKSQQYPELTSGNTVDFFLPIISFFLSEYLDVYVCIGT